VLANQWANTVSHKEKKVFRKDGELVIEFAFTKDSTTLEMDNQIDGLIDSIDDAVSESEKHRIKAQLLEAIKDESRER
jgi:uncharacterized protein YkuJ